jgi:hypothetical protein
MRKATAFYLLLMAVVVTLFYWKTLLTHQFTLIVGTEGVNMEWSWLHFLRDSFHNGRIPLWDPYEFGGAPFAGSMQPAVYYPPQWLFAIVPLTHGQFVSERFYHVWLALQHLLAAWFAFALLRELRRSDFAAFTGGCVFALSGLVVRIIWPLYIASYIWLPAIFLFMLRALRSQRRDRALLEAAFCGFCLAMAVFTGGMVFFVMQGICLAAAIAWYCATHRQWSSGITVLAVAGVTAVGLSAVQLIPASEYAKQTLRFIDGGTFPASQKIPFDRLVPGVWPSSLLSGIFPLAFNGKYGGEEYFSYYVGIFPLVLALIAVWKCREQMWVRYFACLALFAFLYSLGAFSPLYGILYAITPMLWVTRAPNRFFYLISFALSLLAAFGLDALLDTARSTADWCRARPYVKWVAIAAAAGFVIPGLYGVPNLDMWNAFSLLLILVSCGWFTWLTANRAGTGARVLLAAFILFDLAAFNWVELDKASLAKNGFNQMDQIISMRGAAEFIRSQPGPHRVRVGFEPEVNLGDVYGIEGVWGGGAAVLTSYSKLGIHDDLLNVEYVIKPSSAPDPAPAWQDPQWKVYRAPKAFPRAWLVHQTVLAPSQDAAFDQIDKNDLHTAAIVEAPLPVALQQGNAAVDFIRFRSWAPEQFTLDVTASSSALLVLSEMYYPGWIARVNGKPVPIHRVDGAFRGIVVSTGPNRVEFEYAPTSFRIGAWISGLTFIGFVAAWILVWRRSAAG